MSTGISELFVVQTNHSFYRDFALSEREGFHCISSTAFFAGGSSAQDGGVHRLWFLFS